jgi:membrane protease YdiL (CAAX protease family)
MTEKGGAILVALFFSFLAWVVAQRKGFFKSSHRSPPYPLPFKYLVGAFLTYFGTSLFGLPLLHLFKIETKADLYWLQFFLFILIFLTLSIYMLVISSTVRQEILFGGTFKKENLKNMFLGMISWCVAYPFVVLTSLAIGLLTFWIWKTSGVEQTAVKELKEIRNRPLLFSMLSLAIVFFIPFIEELLFRGFLQTFLRRFLGAFGAIFLTSFIFAAFHFSKSLGVGNIELIVSLTVLSCFLGFLYERQRNLFASWGLHMTFNGISVIGILFS